MLWPRHLIGLDHGKARAGDAALHTQRTQQVACKSGLASTQIAMQFDERIANRRVRSKACSECLRVFLRAPIHVKHSVWRAF